MNCISLLTSTSFDIYSMFVCILQLLSDNDDLGQQ